jgi:tRNA threonylcarbamoyladenosine dehydratase
MAQIEAENRIAPDPERSSSPDAFYEELVARNPGIVPEEEQRRLRRATILIAGCGSIGGAAVEPLVRLGAEHLVLAEPDVYEVHNLNRQQAYLSDVGRSKAAVLAGRACDINPGADVAVDERGVVADNVAALVGGASLVIDGIDVTASAPLACKCALHDEARRRGVPVVSGYDIAGAQLVLVYDYRRAGTAVLGGRVAAAEFGKLAPLEFLARVVPLWALPCEIVPELERRLRGASDGFPQVVYSAQLFGVIAARRALDLLAGRPVRRRIVVDVHRLPRPVAARCRMELARLAALVRLSRLARAYRARSGGHESTGVPR